MQPVAEAVLRSWSIPPAATFTLVLTALVYLRGAWLLRRAGYPYLPSWRIASFSLGLFALWFALASPLDTFSGFVLTAHMLQHMILMMVAPPLLLLGEPMIPIVRGMPRFAAREFAGPFLNWRFASRVGLFLTHPAPALILMGAVMFIWHVPGPYELAVKSGTWHQFEHACFFFASIIFWWPVIQPWPSRSQWPRWAMVPYLVIADLQNTVLSAVLVFSERLLYPSYGAGLSLFRFPPQEDQAAAGAFMWVVGSLAFLIPATLIAVHVLSRKKLYGVAIATSQLPHRPVRSGDAFRNSGANLLSGRFRSRSFESVSFVLIFIGVSVALMLLVRSGADDDDQVLRGWQQAGPFAIAVYGSAGELPVGSTDFAVLVQDAQSNAILMDSKVSLSLRNRNDDADQPKLVDASIGDENKLLFQADIDIKSAGAWNLEVTVHRDAEIAKVSFPIRAIPAESGKSPAWPAVVMPTLALILVASYLIRHRDGSYLGASRGVDPPKGWNL